MSSLSRLLSRARPASLAALLAFAAHAGAAAQERVSGQLDERARALIEAAGSPGGGVAVAGPDGISTGVAGLRANGQEAQIRPGDLWHIGSNTKAMTATLAARLVERGVIGWDTTIGQALGGRVDTIHADLRGVTLSELLRHRSGIRANSGLITTLRLRGSDGERDPVADRGVYLDNVLSGRPAGEAGAFLYSNAGYVVAGAMMEAAAVVPYETLMARHVFEPLGMESAGWGPPGRAGELDQPRGHGAGLFGLGVEEPGPGADNPVAMNPAGRAHMSLEDLARFLKAHIERDSDYLRPESWTRLQTPEPGEDYAMGWGTGPDGRLGHAGSNTMWLVDMAVWPDAGTGAAVAVNDGRIDDVARDVRDVLNALGPQSD